MEIIRNLFEQIYLFFNRAGFFGEDIANYLSGKVCDENGVGGVWENSTYWEYGIWVIGIPAVVAFLFYCVVDNIRFSKRRHWLIVFITVFVGFLIVDGVSINNLYHSGVIDSQLQGCAEGVSNGDCFGFGLVNAIMASIVFFLSSLLILASGKSTNCATCPFKVRVKNKSKRK